MLLFSRLEIQLVEVTNYLPTLHGCITIILNIGEFWRNCLYAKQAGHGIHGVFVTVYSL